MIIGVCGFGSSGSSAVTDYLKEFSSTSVLDDVEFTLPFIPDGIRDLDFHLNESIAKYYSSDVAITRFRMCIDYLAVELNNYTDGKFKRISYEYIESISQYKRTGFGSSDYLIYNGWFHRYFGLSIMKARIIPLLEKLLKRDVNVWPMREMIFSIKPDDFYKRTQVFFREILLAMGADFSKPVVLNQPFPGNDPATYFKYFEGAKAIVVDRDPRDTYAFAKMFLRNAGRYIPTDSVEQFVLYYKNMRNDMPYKKNNKDVLVLNFEEFVYNYEETCLKINEFCCIDKKDRNRTLFVPEHSINNTQVFRRYPELAEDIKYIERELVEYLFDFGQYSEITPKGEMFFGRSFLNK